MAGNHDYQNSMTSEARYVDQEGENAADQTTVKNTPTREQTIVTHHDGGTYKRDEGVMGMLPAQPLPLEYALEKALSFREMAAETDKHRSTMTGTRKGGEGAAFNSQTRMMNNYSDDAHRLGDAQREYDMFAPLGNMAVQSYAKMQKVGGTIGIDEGFKLDSKESAALKTAGRTKDNTAMLHDGEGNAVAFMGGKVDTARKTLLGASEKMAALAETAVLQKLRVELAKNAEEKEKIEKKIENIASTVGYLEKAGGMIAGGAGSMLAHAPGAPAALETEADLRPEVYEKTKTVGEHAEKGGGIAESAAKAGLEFFYAGQIDEIDGKIRAITAALPKAEREIAQEKLMSAKDTFAGAAQSYGQAVQAYQLTVNNRRDSMGAIGSKADHEVDPKGGQSNASTAMVWTASTLETQSFLETSMSAGARAQQTVDAAEHSVEQHRMEKWGTLEDAMDVTNTPRSEGLGGPDVQAIKAMRRLTDSWMQGAGKVKAQVDEKVRAKAQPAMNQIGYSGSY